MKATSTLIFLAFLAAAIVGALLLSEPEPDTPPTPESGGQTDVSPPKPRAESEIVGPKGISKRVYKEWRAPRFGERNRQTLTNPVWLWLIEERPETSAADALFRLGDTESQGPAWTFDRSGATETALPDGRIIWIGGRHGSPVDPNAHVYNDLVVKTPDGDYGIIGYPKSLFPPTHSHSATLVSDYVLLIGGLGDSDSTPRDSTQIRAVHIEKYAIEPWSGIGQGPGLIHGHTAKLSENKLWIVVSGGFIQTADGESKPNQERWRLDMDTLIWTQLEDKSETQTP